MKANKTNFKELSKETDPKTCTQGSKYLLPKLKSYSQQDVTSYANLHSKVSSHYPFTHERKPTDSTNPNKTQLSKLSLINYQYISKSPAYFRRQQRSINSVRFDDHSFHQPVESYVESKIKQFNKQALLELVNNRVKTVTNANTKLITNQQPTLNSDSINSRLHKTKINSDKLYGSRSSHKVSYLTTQSRLNLKASDTIDTTQPKVPFKSNSNTKNTLVQKHLAFIDERAQNALEKSSKKFNTLQHQNVEFYETKYSHFQPNQIQNVKNHIQNIKKHPSLKLHLYNFQ